jgi:ferredoxin
MAKVKHLKDLCIGCGACAATCPAHWEMQGDKSHLKDSKELEGDVFELETDDVGCNKEAAENCPVQCIKVEE